MKRLISEQCRFPDVINTIRNLGSPPPPGTAAQRYRANLKAILRTINSPDTAKYLLGRDEAVKMIQDDTVWPQDHHRQLPWPHEEPIYVEYDMPITLTKMGPDDTQEYLNAVIIYPGRKKARVTSLGTKGYWLRYDHHTQDLLTGAVTSDSRPHHESQAEEHRRISRYLARLAARMATA